MAKELTPLAFLKYAFENRAYQRKQWLISAFSLVAMTESNMAKMEKIPLVVLKDENGYYFKDLDGSVVNIVADHSKPLFNRNEKFTIDESWYKGASGETTIGIYLLNKIIFYEPFKNKVNYINELIDDKIVKKVIADLMWDDDDPNIPENKASVSDCLKVSKQANYLLGCNNVFCKPADLDLFTVNPEVIKLRDKLLKEHKDELNDPIVAAKIVSEVVALDSKYMLEGPSKDFFIKGGFLSNARKKMFLVFGIEQDWDTGEYKFITKPLAEGWDLNQIGSYINTAIAGAYGRGLDTANGGVKVKSIQRLTSRVLITEDDCKSPFYENVLIHPDTLDGWIGSSYLNSKGNISKVTGDRSLVGKTLKMRVPNKCITPDNNYCKVCCGDKLSYNNTSLSIECQDLGTGILLGSMKGMHVSGQVDTVTLSLEDMFVI